MKIINYKKIVIAIIFLVTSVIFSAGFFTRAGKFKRIEFSEPLSKTVNISSTEFVWEMEEDIFEKELKVYKKVREKRDLIKKITQEYKYDLNNEDDGMQLGSRSSGLVDFIVNANDKSDKVTLSNGQIKVIADSTLQKLGVDTSQFKFYGYSDRVRAFSYEGHESKQIIEKTAIYHQVIDGYETVGTSSISLCFKGNGLYKATFAYSDLGESMIVKTNSFETVKSMIDKEDCFIQVSNEPPGGVEVEKIIINKVEIVYVDHSIDTEETHIQPCYRFSGQIIYNDGSCNFTLLVRAVPDSYTYK